MRAERTEYLKTGSSIAHVTAMQTPISSTGAPSCSRYTKRKLSMQPMHICRRGQTVRLAACYVRECFMAELRCCVRIWC